MKVTLARLVTVLQQLFFLSTEVAAASANLIKQPRKLTPSAFAQGLVFAWMQHPNASTAQLTSFVAAAGSPLSEPGLCQRFTPAAADFFRALLQEALQLALAAPAAAVPLLARFHGVYLFDSTQLSLPAVLASLWPAASDGTSCLKVLATLELLGGALSLQLGAGRQGDLAFASARAELPRGALRLADMGFFDLDLLAGYQLGGVYWISRAQPQTLVKVPDGRWLSLWRYLSECSEEGYLAELVGLGQGINCRLLAWRCPQEVASRRLQKAQAAASKRCLSLSEAQRVMCQWTVLLSSVPEEMLSADETWLVYRVRWQVELLFKRWKSLGCLGSSRGEKAYRVLVEVYAKLLGCVIQGWLQLTAAAAGPWRSVWKGVMVAQSWGLVLLLALGDGSQLVRMLALLAEALQRVARVAKRRKKPGTMQTLEQPQQNGPRQEPVVPEVLPPPSQPPAATTADTASYTP